METTPTPEVTAAAAAKQAAHEERQAAATALRTEKKARHEQREEEAQQRRTDKLKRKAVNMAKAEEQKENKKKKIAERAVKRDEVKLEHDVQRKAKAQLGATVALDLDAVVAHVQAAAGADAKVIVRGMVPQLSVTFGTKEAAAAFVKKNAHASVGVKLSSRPATDFARMVYFPKEGLGTRTVALAALTAGLGRQKFAFVESFGPNVAVQFNSEKEAEAACAKFKSKGLCIGGVEVGEAATLGKPPRNKRGAKQAGIDAGDAMNDN